jgi:hypothetical protein
MKIYKVNAVQFDKYNLSAVVVCGNEDEAIELAGFSDGDFSLQEAILIGASFSDDKECLCAESL